MPSEPPIVIDMGHPILHVKDLAESVRFYRDVLGFQVADGRHEACCHRVKIAVGSGTLVLFESPEFTPIGLGPQGLGSHFHLHVENFPKAAASLEKRGVRVHREGPHEGTVFDPSGNAIGLRDGEVGEPHVRHPPSELGR
jgi:catechol 2,3-dioxygenase-like lactoylglutathione lyase family enzyme